MNDLSCASFWQVEGSPWILTGVGTIPWVIFSRELGEGEGGESEALLQRVD